VGGIRLGRTIMMSAKAIAAIRIHASASESPPLRVELYIVWIHLLPPVGMAILCAWDWSTGPGMPLSLPHRYQIPDC
jgi:hypothetical protein